MQRLMSFMRSAMEQYNMIDDGDRIAVGVSGGKDSLCLLYALAEMRRFYPKKYDVVAITIDPQFDKKPADYSEIEKLCKKLGVEYVIKRTQLYEIIFEVRKEASPCSLCAKMRRGALHDAAVAAGCNRIALGHHLDDAIETFFMNLFQGGNIACFSPVSYLSRKNLYMIRPMILAEEKYVTKAANKLELPVLESKCPADGETERQRMKEQIGTWRKSIPDIKHKVLGAMQRANVSGWGESEKLQNK